MSVAEPALAQVTPIRGRSLSVDAWLRLKANKAAVASAIYLMLVALACIVGPWFAPNAYDEVFPEFVRTPASLEAYPRVPDIEASLQLALKRARLSATDFKIGEDGTVQRDDHVGQARSTLVSCAMSSARTLPRAASRQPVGGRQIGWC